MAYKTTALSAFFALALSFSPVLASDSSHTKHGTHDHGKHGHNHTETQGTTIKISNAWTRATVKTAKVGGGYLKIVNEGDEPDRLIGAAADFAGRTEIHEMKLVENVMRMRPLPEGLEIPAGGEILLKPGAEHVMFMGLKQQLVKGEAVKAVLTFEKAGKVEVTFQVNSLAAKGAHEGHGNHGDHNKGDHSKHDDHGKHGDHGKHDNHSGHSH